MPAHIEVRAAGGDPTAVAVYLHGILGSGGNWRFFARRFLRTHPHWMSVLVDHRNHGASSGAPAPHTVRRCAEDLGALMAESGAAPAIIAGHSFGGKVALAYAATAPRGLRELWLLDAPIGSVNLAAAGGEEIRQVIAAIRSVEMPAPNRAAALRALRSAGLAAGIAQWLGTSLRPSPDGGYRWSFDIGAIEEMLSDYATIDAWPQLAAVCRQTPVHVVVGGRSHRLSACDLDRLRTLSAAVPTGHLTVHRLADAGHWLHVDDADGLATLLAAAMSRVDVPPPPTAAPGSLP